MVNKQTLIAREIISSHGGQMMFNLKEIGIIINRHQSKVAGLLYENGILVKSNGKHKEADAYDIAEYICKNRTAPIDNVSKAI